MLTRYRDGRGHRGAGGARSARRRRARGVRRRAAGRPVGLRGVADERRPRAGRRARLRVRPEHLCDGRRARPVRSTSTWSTCPTQFRAFDHPIVIGIALAMYLSSSSPTRSRGSTRYGTRSTPSCGRSAARGRGEHDRPRRRRRRPRLAALLGGSIAMTTHVTKASTRAAVNISPEPFSNWVLSLCEDAVAIGLSVLRAAASLRRRHRRDRPARRDDHARLANCPLGEAPRRAPAARVMRNADCGMRNVQFRISAFRIPHFALRPRRACRIHEDATARRRTKPESQHRQTQRSARPPA